MMNNDLQKSDNIQLVLHKMLTIGIYFITQITLIFYVLSPLTRILKIIEEGYNIIQYW